MKCIFQISFFVLLSYSLNAQNQMVREEGTVSFVSSRNVYVKFSSTKNINKGDTLFMSSSQTLIPVLVVNNKSSISTVCFPIDSHEAKVNDVVIAQSIVPIELPSPVEEPQDESFATKVEEEISNDPVIKPLEEDQLEDVFFKEKVKGRISVASYSNLSDYRNTHRMRYAFSFRGQHLKNSRFSFDNYITFRHTLNDSINIADALKVYSLSIKYDFNKSSHITFGRKINPNFSSMGAIDGLQIEKGLGRFQLGAIAGTRPDFQDYSFNINLLQLGAYISHTSNLPGNHTKTTLGIVEQTNRGNTDRRFVYFQHSSQLARNLNLFGSFEVDLFEKINENVSNSAQLTNLYVSLRYRLKRKWRISASYDNRKNIIYYESYRNFIDQLIEDESRQGFRFGISHRTTKTISWGLNGGMRFQKSRANPSRNASAHITFSNIPFINARATVRANFLQTDFLDSQIFGARLSKEIIRGRLSGDLYYRWVDYKYKIGERVLHQNIGGISLNIRIQKLLSFFLFYEGIFDNTNQVYHRFNAKLIKRF